MYITANNWCYKLQTDTAGYSLYTTVERNAFRKMFVSNTTSIVPAPWRPGTWGGFHPLLLCLNEWYTTTPIYPTPLYHIFSVVYQSPALACYPIKLPWISEVGPWFFHPDPFPFLLSIQLLLQVAKTQLDMIPKTMMERKLKWTDWPGFSFESQALFSRVLPRDTTIYK